MRALKDFPRQLRGYSASWKLIHDDAGWNVELDLTYYVMPGGSPTAFSTAQEAETYYRNGPYGMANHNIQAVLSGYTDVYGFGKTKKEAMNKAIIRVREECEKIANTYRLTPTLWFLNEPSFQKWLSHSITTATPQSDLSERHIHKRDGLQPITISFDDGCIKYGFLEDGHLSIFDEFYTAEERDAAIISRECEKRKRQEAIRAEYGE